MTETSSPGSTARTAHWRQVSIALLGGSMILGSSVFLVTVLQAPIGPPIEAAPLFVWNTTAAAVAIVLLAHHNRYGYAASLATSGLVLISLALLASGVMGGINPGSIPLGPISYAGLAVALIITTILAWRTEPTSQPGVMPGQ